MIKNILFPCEPFSPRNPEPDFLEEYQAARAAGFEVGLYDDEEHRLVSRHLEGPTLYRGWMMPAERYAGFAAHLTNHGLALITSAESYRLCHHLPAWYPLLKEHTPKSRWCSAEACSWPLADFEESALIVKDYVKSAKHYWHEACFIPDSSKAESVVTRFKELRGTDLEGGLVFREFLPLKSIGSHHLSGAPLTLEYRLFFWQHKLLAARPYWEKVDYPEQTPPTAHFEELAVRIDSPFFTMDVAYDEQGKWWVIELGDGQVAQLPEQLSPAEFYAQIG